MCVWGGGGHVSPGCHEGTPLLCLTSSSGAGQEFGPTIYTSNFELLEFISRRTPADICEEPSAGALMLADLVWDLGGSPHFPGVSHQLGHALRRRTADSANDQRLAGPAECVPLVLTSPNSLNQQVTPQCAYSQKYNDSFALALALGPLC